MARDDGQSAFTGRIKRYAQVTTTMSGLAARLAGERYLGAELDRAKHAAQLREALGGLKGPLMKVAQILSTIPEALPREYAEELSALQADAPPMGWLFVKRRMAAELGNDWQQKFAQFDKQACSAASLGQVHKAEVDGAPVAVKLQYPDMASAIDADLRQLKLIFSVYERFDKAISTGDVYDELSERLREELDYRREAQNMALYRHMLADEPVVHMPEALPELTSARALTMRWVEGRKLMDFLSTDPSQEERNQLAVNMFKAWYVPFYFYGVIHGDPHMGNYSVRPDLSVNLMDFGCIRIFPPHFVGGVIDLHEALKTNNTELAVHAYEQWGFKNLSDDMIEVLNIWARFVYSPLLEDSIRPIQETHNGNKGRELAGKVYEELKKMGGVRPPREFVLLDRAAIGLGSVFMHLKAEVNWYQIYHEMIEEFDVQTLAARQRKAVLAAGLPETLLSQVS